MLFGSLLRSTLRELLEIKSSSIFVTTSNVKHKIFSANYSKSILFLNLNMVWEENIKFNAFTLQSGNSQNFLRKFVRFFVTLKCLYGVVIHIKSVFYVSFSSNSSWIFCRLYLFQLNLSYFKCWISYKKIKNRTITRKTGANIELIKKYREHWILQKDIFRLSKQFLYNVSKLYFS